MRKKKVCFNPECSSFRKEKFKATDTVCPACQSDLDWVCAGKDCFKLITKTEKYCPICQAERNDKTNKIIDNVKKWGGAAITLGLMIGAVISKENSEKK